MKRSWNWFIWIGFLFILAGFLSYTFFIQFPITRDFPWVNLLLLGIGGTLLAIGVERTFAKPETYRGKIFGPIFAVLGLVVIVSFAYIVFYMLKQVPPSTGAPRVGQKAPEFALPDQDGKPTALVDLISSHGAVLIFYRGFW